MQFTAGPFVRTRAGRRTGFFPPIHPFLASLPFLLSSKVGAFFLRMTETKGTEDFWTLHQDPRKIGFYFFIALSTYRSFWFD